MSRAIVLRVAREEWRYWRRSRLALVTLGVGLLIILIAIATTAVRVQTEHGARHDMQALAEARFLEQPARHPHRMVHYGHYVFREPPPLAVIDPGVDAVTGTVMFLEGHRQNSATFSPFFATALAGEFANLTPALVYQLLAPLLLIVVGFSSLAREREAGTDRLLYATSLSPLQLWGGKALALTGLCGLLMVPLLLAGTYAVATGESGGATAALLGGYALYLLIWALIVVGVSAWSSRSAAALLGLLVAWIVLGVLAPGVVASLAERQAPTQGKLRTDLEVARTLRDEGDGHNASDPAFASLRAGLLSQYNVDKIEDLPVNFRGVVAEFAEARLTDILNRFAEQRLELERRQSDAATSLSLLSPRLAMSAYSLRMANTDLAQLHQFLRSAEDNRFAFVQGLNKLHATDMSYVDDINRSANAESERRTRLNAENWRLLESFDAPLPDAAQRMDRAWPALLMMLLWAAVGGGLGCYGALRSAARVNA
ncbi:MAG: DUF3526 domain-containing protein [Pseudomonadota bacterium]